MMRVYENGRYRDATSEEILEMKLLEAELPQPEPDPNEQRMNEIEAALIELAALIAGGA